MNSGKCPIYSVYLAIYPCTEAGKGLMSCFSSTHLHVSRNTCVHLLFMLCFIYIMIHQEFASPTSEGRLFFSRQAWMPRLSFCFYLGYERRLFGIAPVVLAKFEGPSWTILLSPCSEFPSSKSNLPVSAVGS